MMVENIVKLYVYYVSNFRPLGLYQETNNWINVVSYISIVLISQPVKFNMNNVMILSWAIWRHFQYAKTKRPDHITYQTKSHPKYLDKCIN